MIPQEIGNLRERVLILPMCLILDESTAQAILEFVKQGGVLIAENRTGLFDERGFLQANLPGGGLSEALGIREEEALFSDPENRPLLNNPACEPWPDEEYSGPELAFTWPLSAGIRARKYLTALDCDMGPPLPHSDTIRTDARLCKHTFKETRSRAAFRARSRTGIDRARKREVPKRPLTRSNSS